MASNNYRLRAIKLYKELHRIGREYPEPNYDFHGKIRRLFERTRNLEKDEEIEKALALAEHIKNETIALYQLKKYRHLHRTYYRDHS